MRPRLCVALAPLLLAGALPQLAGAAAFQLKERSAQAQGRAFAGSVSSADDASVVTDNPAAMRLLHGAVAEVDLSALDYAVRFHGGGHDAIGRPLAGGNGGDAGSTQPVPAIYLHLPVGERAHLGASLIAPFGLQTVYDRHWAGRYQGVKTQLKTADLGVSASYDATPMLSFGASVFVERILASLDTAVDFGAILAGAGVPGYAPTSADGESRISAGDTAFGGTAGLLFVPSDTTRIGLAYRSEVKHEFTHARARFDVPGDVATILAGAYPGLFTDTSARATLTMPASLTLSLTQRLDERWQLMADLARTKWSVFRQVTFRFASAQPDESLDFGYRDGTFAALGTDYALSERLTLRAGIAYDHTPVTAALRDVRVPDVDRRWLALGATWRAESGALYSLGLTHMFLGNPAVSRQSSTGSDLVGRYDLTSDTLAVSAQYGF